MQTYLDQCVLGIQNLKPWLDLCEECEFYSKVQSDKQTLPNPHSVPIWEFTQTFCWVTSQAPLAWVPESSVLNFLERPTAAPQSQSGLIPVRPHFVENVSFESFLTRGLNPTSPIRRMTYVGSICWFAARTVRLERVRPYHLVMLLWLLGH